MTVVTRKSLCADTLISDIYHCFRKIPDPRKLSGAARVFRRSDSGDDLQSIPSREKTGWVFSRALGGTENFIQIYGMALMGTAVSLHHG